MHFEWNHIVTVLLIWLAASAVLLKFGRPSMKPSLFALFNISAIFFAFFVNYKSLVIDPEHWYLYIRYVPFSLYFVFLSLCYLWIRLFAKNGTKLFWIAFLFPVLILVVFKSIDAKYFEINGRLVLLAGFVGISYMAFRISWLSLEVRNEITRSPTFLEFLSFVYFPLTFFMGPISSFALFRTSLNDGRFEQGLRALFRILVGLTKVFFVATLFKPLTFDYYLFDEHSRTMVQIFVSCVAYLLFLYFEFSGFCDLVIGGSRLLGIEIEENFNSPFLARNLKEFWQRWHITLTRFLEVCLFAPLTKYLTRVVGPKYLLLSVTVSALTTFVVLGMWHGIAVNYLVFGIMHGVGIALVSIYAHLLRRLTPEQSKRYHESYLVAAASRVMTFSYVSVSMLFFANNIDDKLLQILNGTI